MKERVKKRNENDKSKNVLMKNNKKMLTNCLKKMLNKYMKTLSSISVF